MIWCTFQAQQYNTNWNLIHPKKRNRTGKLNKIYNFWQFRTNHRDFEAKTPSCTPNSALSNDKTNETKRKKFIRDIRQWPNSNTIFQKEHSTRGLMHLQHTQLHNNTKDIEISMPHKKRWTYWKLKGIESQKILCILGRQRFFDRIIHSALPVLH